MAEQQTVNSQAIPEQIVNSGSDISINLAQYFSASEGAPLSYSASGLPQGITIDAKTGELNGTAPKIDIDAPFLASITATIVGTEATATEFFPLTILASGSAQAEGAIKQTFEDTDYLEAARRWELLRWIQFIINEHYATVYIYDGQNPPKAFGLLQEKHKAKTGFTILNYENYVVIHTGEMAFAESGNRGRLVRSLEEAFKVDVYKRAWLSIGITGSDADSVSKAWVVGQLEHMPVSDTAPSDEALFNLRNLQRLRGEYPGPGVEPAPGG